MTKMTKMPKLSKRPGAQPKAGRPGPAPLDTTSPNQAERIAKRIARAGVCSRRDAERLIEQGKVTLNGQKLMTPAVTVTARDRIEIEGTPLPAAERTRLWLLNKKGGTVTTDRDPEGRATVFAALPNDLPRVLSIGRLDINTEGLLLLTNDGGLARELELPATGWLRRYRVRAHGTVDQTALDGLKDGIAIDGVLYGSIEAEIERQQGSNTWMTFAMREGKNREVKKVLGALGLEVNRLIRVSYGPFQLGDLAAGAVREVRGRTLRDQLGAALIERAGANFDAPLQTRSDKAGASKKPVKAEGEPSAKGQPMGKSKAKLKKTSQRKADPLSRLTTQKPGSVSRSGKKPKGGAGGGTGGPHHADRRR